MFLEGKEKKHSCMIRSGSLENSIGIRTCSRLCKWQRGSEMWRDPAPMSAAISPTQPEDNLVVSRNTFRPSFRDCSFNGLFRKDSSLTLSVALCLNGPAACVKEQGQPSPPFGCAREIKQGSASFAHRAGPPFSRDLSLWCGRNVIITFYLCKISGETSIGTKLAFPIIKWIYTFIRRI